MSLSSFSGPALISDMTGMSRKFVTRWTRSDGQDCSEDRRGWKRGLRRKWSDATEERIRAIHRDIVLDATQFYRGPTAIRQEWQRRFTDSAPPLRTIGQMLADLGL